VLKVSDEGRGLGSGGASSGIGMRLVRSLVRQCRGELDVAHEGGASFTVSLPERGQPSPSATQSQLL
jgi:two-component sensor histidine kinase